MLKRYDVTKDEFVEVTQEYYNELEKRLDDMSIHYKENAPLSFKEFYNNYVLTGKTNA